MDKQYLYSFFIRGDLPGAIEYMSQFEEMNGLVESYRNIFMNEQYLTYDIPEKLNDILIEYQRYFRDVFYCRMNDEAASSLLFERLSNKLGISSVSESDVEEELNKLFEQYGYHILTGRTNGHHGPYVWKETVPTTYEVELPCGIRQYTVNILRGFVMRSWMDYVSFGKIGTGGWAGVDGTINCVEQAYDFESDSFRVSLLKHEAQHVEDMAKWPDITPAELEYRAKLVELIYSEDQTLLSKFISEADSNRTYDSHAMANAKIADEMSDYVGKTTIEIHQRAKELFDVSSRRSA